MKRMMSVALGILVPLVLAFGPAAASSDAGEEASHLPDFEAVNIWVFPPDPGPEMEISLNAFVWNNSDVIVDGPIVIVIGIEGVEVVERVIPMLHPWEAVPLGPSSSLSSSESTWPSSRSIPRTSSENESSGTTMHSSRSRSALPSCCQTLPLST